MRISDILKQDALSLSFEVFPPKTTSAFESVKTATEEIAALGPAFVSVTYGAGGGTSKNTRWRLPGTSGSGTACPPWHI